MRRWPPALAVLLILLYAALLRLDAYTAKYGRVESPAWARVLTTSGAALGSALRPYEQGWPSAGTPYVGGDPINYLRFAREMTSFYQGHVREPMFLALTRAYLWLLDGRDAALSFASATGSVLLVVATFLLASIFVPRVVAAAAALAIAVDYEILTWSVDGWRDDLFAATTVGTAWAMLRLRESPSPKAAVVLGLLGAAACLTRLSAITFILPSLVWLVLDAQGNERLVRLRAASIAILTTTLLVAPYLVNCAIQLGDPLYAINVHTGYYRYRAGLPDTGGVSAASYVHSRLASRPVETLDVGLRGLFVHPYVSKWSGLDPVLGRARTVVFWAGVIGLVAMSVQARGRLFLVVLFASLLPYALTWNIGGGGAFRFTMHAYSFYVVAAAWVLWTAIAATVASVRARQLPVRPRTAVTALGAGVLCAAAAATAYTVAPWLVVREAIAAGDDANVQAGERDTPFFGEGWTDPHHDTITFRVSQGERSVVWLPLPAKRDYEIVLRVDPVAPAVGQELYVLFNGQFVSRFDLGFDPERMGSYRLRVRAEHVHAGRNQLVLAPQPVIAAASADPRFGRLPPDLRIGVRLWYVRVLARE